MSRKKKLIIAACLIGVVLLTLDLTLAQRGVRIAELILAAIVVLIFFWFD